MPVDYEYHPIDRTIRVRCTGELTVVEIFRYFSDIAEDDSIAFGAVELVDLSEVSHFNVEPSGAADMPSEYALARGKRRTVGTVAYGANRINRSLVQLIRAHFRKSMPTHPFFVVDSLADALTAADRIHQGETPEA